MPGFRRNNPIPAAQAMPVGVGANYGVVEGRADQANPLADAQRYVGGAIAFDEVRIDDALYERKKSQYVNESVKTRREFVLGLAYKAMAGTANKTAHDIVDTAKVFMDYINSPEERRGA